MSGFTAKQIEAIRQRVDIDVAPKTRMIIHDVWIGHVRITAYRADHFVNSLSARVEQAVYEVIDNRTDSEETFGSFANALNRAIEILTT